MKFNLTILFIFIQYFAIPVIAQPAHIKYSTHIKRSNNLYEFYFIINQKDSILVQKDNLEETYYGDRKIPDSIQTSINQYNANELILNWTEHNTLSEGETGTDGTLKKYIAVIDLVLKEEIFRYKYYHSKEGWKSVMSGENNELKTNTYQDIICNHAVIFSNKKITVKNLKIKKSISFLYDPNMKKYIEQ